MSAPSSQERARHRAMRKSAQLDDAQPSGSGLVSYRIARAAAAEMAAVRTRVSAGRSPEPAHPRARRPGRVRTRPCRVKEHLVDGRIGRMARATERKVTGPLSRGASMPGSGQSSHNRGRRKRTLVMAASMDSRFGPSRAGGPRAPGRGRRMSKLNFRSLGIALLVVVILVVAIAASWSYHSVPSTP